MNDNNQGKTIQSKNRRAVDDIASMLEIRQFDKTEWNQKVLMFSDYNYRQTWDYGLALASRRCAISEHVGIFKGDQLLGIADVRIKRMPILPGGIAYISGGPLTMLNRTIAKAEFISCIAALSQEYVKGRNLLLRITPPTYSSNNNAIIARCLEDMGFSLFEQGITERTFLLDIDQDEIEIRKKLLQKWRNCLNAGEKNTFDLKVGIDDSYFQEFSSILKPLMEKKNFHVDLGIDFYASIQKCLCAPDKLLVFLVSSNNEIHSGGIFSMHGNTCTYLLGATTELGLKSKASYFLHWQVIKFARSRGMKFYDLGGIDPEANPGVYSFKKGFGGDDVTAAGPYELAKKGLYFTFVKSAESIYKRLR